jgi:hypothetical protein
MKNIWLRALAVWVGIMAAETVHGIARVVWLAPAIGDFHARQASVLTASVVIFAVVLATIQWIDAGSERTLLNIGAAWMALTVAFELMLGRAMGLSWTRIMEDYNLIQGGLMPLGLLFLSFAPWLAMRVRRRIAAARYYPVACRLPFFRRLSPR